MPQPFGLKIGDEVVTMLTGVIGDFRARVVAFDDLRGGRPVLEVVTTEGKEHPRYGKKCLMKDGDYIIQGRFGEVAPHWSAGARG